MTVKQLLLSALLCGSFSLLNAQVFTKQDSLRGSITPERAWWDVQHYALDVEVFPETKRIQGTNTISYRVLDDQTPWMQIELQAPMKLEKASQKGKTLNIRSEGAVHFIETIQPTTNTEAQVTLTFSGTPKVANNPPWDGGFTWKTDANGNPFIATSNQGIGASIWWPNKDHPEDEPDRGIQLSITAPSSLVAVGNGRLIDTITKPSTKTWVWEVTNPINNYGVNVNIGDYVNFTESYEGLKGPLDLSYWVLRDNLAKAKGQFLQVPMMLRAFEYWMGPYPFYEDSFKLVEVPYLGMEHQSSVTYGNRYQNGYLGRDLSGSGWGLEFDFIIIHEAGHEWFANNITHKDVADMWIHEGFTAYSESLYLDYHFGPQAASEYVIGTRRLIQNDRPLIGTYGVGHEGSGDIYYKGANLLHTLRQLLEDDKKWRAILVEMNREFYHQTVSSQQIELFLSKATGIDLTEFWQQYLRTTMIPTLEYQIDGKDLEFRYTDIVPGFDMPVRVRIDDKEQWIFPKGDWNEISMDTSIQNLTIDENFYIRTKKITP